MKLYYEEWMMPSLAARRYINWNDLKGYTIEHIILEDAGASLSGGPEKRAEIYLAHDECPSAIVVMRHELLPGGSDKPILTHTSNTLEQESYYLAPKAILAKIKDTCDSVLRDVFETLSWSLSQKEDKN